MEAVGAVKLDLETWKKNSAVDLHVLNRCLCRRSGGGEYLLKSTVAYQHRRGVDDAAGTTSAEVTGTSWTNHAMDSLFTPPDKMPLLHTLMERLGE